MEIFGDGPKLQRKVYQKRSRCDYCFLSDTLNNNWLSHAWVVLSKSLLVHRLEMPLL